ncbi:MAG: hypothetical protein NTW96_07200 [Planctomycetia bacterium]|nr:hypothetical protein [Planctomycetia bacterium]
MRGLWTAFIVVLVLLAVRVEAAELTEADLDAGKRPAVGDSVLLKDFSRCTPNAAVVGQNVKGKWWLRPYRTSSGATGKMLCVEARDKDNPQTCIAPELTYPVNLDGVYDIWVGTYQPLFGGGIDIKLSRDKVYGTIDPQEVSIGQWPLPRDQYGTLVQVLFKTADLTGQQIHLRQPHGTYQSLWWGLCNAHVAAIKLVRRDPEEVKHQEATRCKLPKKGVILDRDGFSYVWNWGTERIDCILQQVEQCGQGNVEALNWCIGGSMETNFPHPMTKSRIVTVERLGDRRATKVHGDFESRGVDVLKELAARCHELGIKIYASHRANVRYYSSDIWDAHPDWHLANQLGLDYAKPEARNFYRDFLLCIAEKWDIDGLTIDFSRHRRHFNDGLPQPEQFQHMNQYVRDLRAGLNRIGKAKNRQLELNVSFTTGTWYDDWTAEQQGLDVQTWVNEKLVDRIMPEGRQVAKYVEMCRGKPTKCYGRYCAAMDLAGNALQSDLHDPTPAEDKTDRPAEMQYGPLNIAKGVLDWYDAGAEGVFLFNMEPWATLRDLPYPDVLRQEIQAGITPSMLKGERVEWEE